MQGWHLPRVVGYVTYLPQKSSAEIESYCIKPAVTGYRRGTLPSSDESTWKYYPAQGIRNTCRAMAEFLTRVAKSGTLVEVTENPEVTTENPHIILLTRIM